MSQVDDIDGAIVSGGIAWASEPCLARMEREVQRLPVIARQGRKIDRSLLDALQQRVTACQQMVDWERRRLANLPRELRETERNMFR